MLRVIIRRRLLVVVVVIVRVRHLARIEGLPRIINAMAPGAGRRRPPPRARPGGEIENGWWWQDEGSLSETFGDKDSLMIPGPAGTS